MTFSLPESLQTFVAQQVASGKYPNAEAYLQALIEADQRQQAREHLDALLEEGLASPTGEMTTQDWEHIRRRVREHYGSTAAVNPKIRRSAQSVEDVYEIATYLLKDGLSVTERFLDADRNYISNTRPHSAYRCSPRWFKTLSGRTAALESTRVREFYDFLSSHFQRH